LDQGAKILTYILSYTCTFRSMYPVFENQNSRRYFLDIQATYLYNPPACPKGRYYSE
jgi:hypothetical protein